MDQEQTPPSDIPQTQPTPPAPTAPISQEMAAPAPIASTPEMAAPAPVAPAAPIVTADQQADVTTTKIIAFFSYLSLLFLIPMFLRPNDPLCKYHARQGMLLFFTWLGVRILGVIGREIHTALGVLFYSLDGLALFIFIAIGVYNVWQGRLAPLPLIGGLADKLSSKLKTPAQTPAQ